jgi:hypothetical protein
MNFKTNYWWEIKARGLDATLKQKLLPTEQLLKSDDLIDMFGGGSLVTEDSPSTLSWICYKSGVVQICRWWIDCNYSLYWKSQNQMKLIALIKLLHGCCKQVYECKVYIGSDN